MGSQPWPLRRDHLHLNESRSSEILAQFVPTKDVSSSDIFDVFSWRIFVSYKWILEQLGRW